MKHTQPESAWFAPLVAAAAEAAAKRELAAVRGAAASGEANALAKAFYAHRAGLAKLMDWSDERTDGYCLMRLHRLAAEGVPSDDLVFVQAATAQIIEFSKGDL